jgi:hypothetical protein
MAQAVVAAFNANGTLCKLPIAHPLIPTTVPKGNAYMPLLGAGQDFDTDSVDTGWKCSGFSIKVPMCFQLAYSADKAVSGSVNNLAPCNAAPCFEVLAFHDFDGDDILGQVSITGHVFKGKLIVAPAFISMPAE